ncbi:type II secretion system F family protein [Azospirillum sp.]|uniref:type II secretion system F family protein n=1 Tax=Azospirillum sp. TaxID=34012 RepID=UPI002D5EB28E|nr:type II secretion system F family protein [Azospirillum sp.]HYD66410.1 type II secretion system F family protein [Azospirillum sp.]
MSIDPHLLLYGALFLSVLCLVEGLYLLLSGRPMWRRAVNRRQRLLDNGTGREDTLAVLLRRDGGKAGRLSELAPVRRLDRLVQQAGASVATARLLIGMVVAAVAFGLIGGAQMEMAPPTAAVFGLASGVGLPLAWLNLARKRRLKRFGDQLPDALDVIVRSLRAGHPVPVAMKLVAEQMADPIGSEFGIVVDEMTYGLETREALERMAQRVGHAELGLVTVAIKIQYQSGGNLAEVLAGLSRIIRARAGMLRKVAALSAEGRMSATMLTALPVVVAGAITLLSPDYFSQVQGDPLFPVVLTWAGCGLLTGILMVWRMVNLRV